MWVEVQLGDLFRSEINPIFKGFTDQVYYEKNKFIVCSAISIRLKNLC